MDKGEVKLFWFRCGLHSAVNLAKPISSAEGVSGTNSETERSKGILGTQEGATLVCGAEVGEMNESGMK